MNLDTVALLSALALPEYDRLAKVYIAGERTIHVTIERNADLRPDLRYSLVLEYELIGEGWKLLRVLDWPMKPQGDGTLTP